MIINSFEDSKNIKHAVIALHGWTGDEFSMEAIAKAMGPLSAKWYLPRAPYNADTGKGYTWFSGSDVKGWKYEKTLNMIPQIMKNISIDGFTKENIFMIGFSMGAGLAILSASRLPYPIGGVVPIAGYIKKAENLTSSMTNESLQTPFLIIQGTKDEIVTPFQAQETVTLLKGIGYIVTYELYNANHKVPKMAIPRIKEFILKY